MGVQNLARGASSEQYLSYSANTVLSLSIYLLLVGTRDEIEESLLESNNFVRWRQARPRLSPFPPPLNLSTSAFA